MAPNTNIDLYTAGSTSMPQLDHYHLVFFRRLVSRRERGRERKKEKDQVDTRLSGFSANIPIEQPPTATRSPSPSKNSACNTMCTNWSSARTSRRSLGSLKSTVRTNPWKQNQPSRYFIPIPLDTPIPSHTTRKVLRHVVHV